MTPGANDLVVEKRRKTPHLKHVFSWLFWFSSPEGPLNWLCCLFTIKTTFPLDPRRGTEKPRPTPRFVLMSAVFISRAIRSLLLWLEGFYHPDSLEQCTIARRWESQSSFRIERCSSDAVELFNIAHDTNKSTVQYSTVQYTYHLRSLSYSGEYCSAASQWFHWPTVEWSIQLLVPFVTCHSYGRWSWLEIETNAL